MIFYIFYEPIFKEISCETIFSLQLPLILLEENSQHPKVKYLRKVKRDLDKIKIRNKPEYTSYASLNLNSLHLSCSMSQPMSTGYITEATANQSEG